METEKRSPVSSLLLSAGVAVVLLTPLVVYVVLRTQETGAGLRKDQAAAEVAAQTPQVKQAIPLVESDTPRPRLASKRAPVVMAAPQPAPPPQSPFPTPRDIPVGLDKQRLIASFGRPSFVTTEVTEGRASEIFRYLRPDSGVETVVFLRSGRVINATSSVY